MDKEIISNKQGSSIMVLFTLGSSLVIGLGSEAKQDAWLTVLIALAASLPLLFLYSKLLTIYPGKSLYDIILEAFGPIIGRIICLLYIWYSFHLGALVLRNFSEFINVISFPETPQFVFIIFLGIVCIQAVKSGIEVLGRISAFMIPLLLFLILLTLILSTTKINFINIKPFLYNGISPVLKNSFAIFSFPFAETVVFTMALHTLKNNKKTTSVFMIGVIIGGIILLMTTLMNTLVLGVPTADSLYFPFYVTVRSINIGDFLQRIEATVAISFIVTGFVKISVCLYAACTGFAKLFNLKNYRTIVAPIAFLMMNLACLIYDSAMEMFKWAVKIYPYYAIPFQIILPILIYVAAIIKYKRKKNPSA